MRGGFARLAAFLVCLGSADLNVSEFDYDLPEHLIAQAPVAQRGESRLLCVDRNTGVLHDRQFRDFADWLRPDDLLVMNNTRVLNARLIGTKPTGGRVEFLVERLVSETSAIVLARSNKPLKVGAEVFVDGECLLVVAREGRFTRLQFPRRVLEILEKSGRTPLPPYIRRESSDEDALRYQTVYAKVPGAVAAPTAGLHIDEDFLRAVSAKGVRCAFVTLHVGAGTFQPVRSDIVEHHEMHEEQIEVSAEVCEAVIETRRRGNRVVAVGTTTVRALESASAAGEPRPTQGGTGLFIYPGYEFRSVDAMLTNFHLPKSTLLMMISAFASHAIVMRAYEHAITQAYRFFSYGDAMLLGENLE